MSNNTVIQSSYPNPTTTQSPDSKDLSNRVETLGIATTQRQIYVCTDPTIANCYSKQTGLKSWECLKQRLQKLKIC